MKVAVAPMRVGFVVVLHSVVLAAAILVSAGCERESMEGPLPDAAVFDIPAHYTKNQVHVPMRDGVSLFATVYVPRDTTQKYPFMIKRSPYSSGPYEAGVYRDHLGPTGSGRFAEEGFIFVYQDVRGRFMSEGEYLNVTPHEPVKDDPEDVDESSDMYDTVEWLLENVHPNNGKVGIWGISYPGFYTSASIVDNHPAIAAASPQAAVTDWFVGDDFHHNGAFFLQDAFSFFPWFESPGENPTTSYGERFDFGTEDAYRFYLDIGPLPNVNKRYFHNKVAFWDSLMAHGTYDEFWKRRTIVPHLYNVTTAVMNVGGFFDAEDPYGPIAVYESIEEKNPGITNTLVMGPWFHGGWVRGDGASLGNVSFGSPTSTYYQEHVDLPFFNYYLKGEGSVDLPEVLAYATGSDEWYRFNEWPPSAAEPLAIYLADGGKLGFNEADITVGHDEYVSDPANPVPYTQEVKIRRTREFIVEDQRFAAERADVLTYQSDILTEDYTFVGPVQVDLFVSTTGTDADFVVKLIDVFPDDEPEWQVETSKYLDVPMAGYQMMVRGEVFRAKFRNSFEEPEPLVPGDVTEISFKTPDILHTFEAGHRIMIQIQSSWFPLVDRNPQTFVDIYNASESDFQTATHRIHRGGKLATRIEVGRLN